MTVWMAVGAAAACGSDAGGRGGTSANRPPVISGTPPTRAIVGDTYTFVPTAFDPDGDPLTFSITHAPAWASFDQATGTLTGTPRSWDARVAPDIVISASDGKASVNLPSFTIRIPGWEAVPLVTAESRAAGHTGGEGCQVVESIAIDSSGTFLMMGKDGGQFSRSLDGGAHWEPADLGLRALGTRTIAIDPNDSDRVLLVGTVGYANLSYIDAAGIWLSTDRGRTWSQKLRFVTTSTYDHNELAWDESSAAGSKSTVAYWSASGSFDSGFFKSVDGGVTWSKIQTGTTYGDGSVAVHPTKGYVYLANANGFFRSTDGGVGFTQVLSGSFRGVDVSRSQPDFVALVGESGVLVSNDAGKTFARRAATGLPNDLSGLYGIRVSPVDSSHMMLANDVAYYSQQMYYSLDGGDTWAQPIPDTSNFFFPYSDAGAPNAKGRVWHPKDPRVLFITSDFVMKSTDGGAHVFYSDDGDNAVFATGRWAFNPFNPDLVAMSDQDYSGGAFSSDGGDTWRTFANALPRGHTYGAYAFSESSLFFAVAYPNWDSPRTLYASSNGGASWIAAGPTSDSDPAVVSPDPAAPNVGFWNEWRTADQGKSWVRLSGCDRVFAYDPSSKALYGVSGPLYPPGSANTVVKSTDHGVTWSSVFTAPDIVWDLAYDQDRERIYVASGDDEQTSHLYQWQSSALTDITGNLPADQEGAQSARTVAVDPTNPSVIYAGRYIWRFAQPVAVMRSTDAGASWTALTLKPGDSGVAGGGHATMAVRVDPQTRYLWVTTEDYGIWKYPPPDP